MKKKKSVSQQILSRDMTKISNDEVQRGIQIQSKIINDELQADSQGKFFNSGGLRTNDSWILKGEENDFQIVTTLSDIGQKLSEKESFDEKSMERYSTI